MSKTTLEKYEDWYKAHPIAWRGWNYFRWKWGLFKSLLFGGLSPGEELLLRVMASEKDEVRFSPSHLWKKLIEHKATINFFGGKWIIKIESDTVTSDCPIKGLKQLLSTIERPTAQ